MTPAQTPAQTPPQTAAKKQAKKTAKDTRAKAGRCGWCGEAFVQHPKGRPRRWCKQSCRQRAFEARKYSQRLGVDDAALMVDRHQYELLLDRRYEVVMAVRDIRKDQNGDQTGRPPEQLDWLLSHVERLLEVSVEPKTAD